MPSRSGCPGKVRGRSLSICFRTRRNEVSGDTAVHGVRGRRIVAHSCARTVIRHSCARRVDQGGQHALHGVLLVPVLVPVLLLPILRFKTSADADSPAATRSSRNTPSRRRSLTRAKICQRIVPGAPWAPPATSARSSRSSSLSSDASSPLPRAALASRTRTARRGCARHLGRRRRRRCRCRPFCARNASHRVARSASSSTYIGALRLYASTCSGLTCANGGGRGGRVRRRRGRETRSGCPVEMRFHECQRRGRERGGARTNGRPTPRRDAPRSRKHRASRAPDSVSSSRRTRASVEGLHPPATASRALVSAQLSNGLSWKNLPAERARKMENSPCPE